MNFGEKDSRNLDSDYFGKFCCPTYKLVTCSYTVLLRSAKFLLPSFSFPYFSTIFNFSVPAPIISVDVLSAITLFFLPLFPSFILALLSFLWKFHYFFLSSLFLLFPFNLPPIFFSVHIKFFFLQASSCSVVPLRPFFFLVAPLNLSSACLCVSLLSFFSSGFTIPHHFLPVSLLYLHPLHYSSSVLFYSISYLMFVSLWAWGPGPVGPGPERSKEYLISKLYISARISAQYRYTHSSTTKKQCFRRRHPEWVVKVYTWWSEPRN